MYSKFQFKHHGFHTGSSVFRPLAAAVSFLFVLLLAGGLRAQEAPPPGTVGRLEGADISVENGSVSGGGTATIAPSIFVQNGSVVTVHAGQARLTLINGGEIDICGPAKLTLLQSGGSITLALNFGRMHVRLPASVDLRIFTPTIVATPLDVGGGPRDVTLGLELDDSLCVLASSGAIQLEHQFTGEKLIVPQGGEFFLSEGKLLPVAGKPGSCQCEAMAMPVQSQPVPAPAPLPSIPDIGLTAPPLQTQTPPQGPPTAAATDPQASQPSVEFSIPAHPASSPENNTPATPAPPVSVPVYTVIAPPLTFSASSPAPRDPPPDMVLMVREARVDPEWQFSGHVDAPAFAQALQQALGEKSAASQPTRQPAKKKRGFWGVLRKIFEGNGAQD